MESLADTKWDAVISGTGLQQSLLALALSRSDKQILHVDPNEYYGGAEAALSLDEVEAWATKHASSRTDGDGLFTAARVVRERDDVPLSSRSYNIALAPQFIHAKSQLISQLVSSKAFRQIEFLAVGSFFVLQPDSSTSSSSLARIPSTREDVFLNTSIPARAKRSLMKFLKFVLEFDLEENADVWKPHARTLLSGFLTSVFKLDESLRSYVVALTLSADGRISVEDGLRAIHKHMTSIGIFGAGFAALYPKWGGLSEVAQVGCRALAVGGAVYMLGTGVTNVLEMPSNNEIEAAKLEIKLDNDLAVRSKTLVRASEQRSPSSHSLYRLTAVVDSSLSSLFETVVDGAPPSAVTVVALPQGSIFVEDTPFDYPIYAMVHSSITGECPNNQSIIYFSTISSPASNVALDIALTSLLNATVSDAGLDSTPRVLYRLYYEQAQGPASTSVDGNIINMPSTSLALAFDDTMLQPVRDAWDALRESGDEGVAYMNFEDREGQDDVDDVYD